LLASSPKEKRMEEIYGVLWLIPHRVRFSEKDLTLIHASTATEVKSIELQTLRSLKVRSDRRRLRDLLLVAKKTHGASIGTVSLTQKMVTYLENAIRARCGTPIWARRLTLRSSLSY
jgi:hypothetical protein